MNVLYEYRLSGRRPAVWLCGVVFVFMAGLMAWHRPAIVMWLPLLIGGALIVWALWRNPVNGMQVTADELILSPWQKPRTIPLREIEAVR